MPDPILPPPAIDVHDVDYHVTVEFGGEKFKLPGSADDWPFEASAALDEDRLGVFVRELLGDDYARLRKLRPTNRDVAGMIDDYFGRIGLKSAGN